MSRFPDAATAPWVGPSRAPSSLTLEPPLLPQLPQGPTGGLSPCRCHDRNEDLLAGARWPQSLQTVGTGSTASEQGRRRSQDCKLTGTLVPPPPRPWPRPTSLGHWPASSERKLGHWLEKVKSFSGGCKLGPDGHSAMGLGAVGTREVGGSVVRRRRAARVSVEGPWKAKCCPPTSRRVSGPQVSGREASSLPPRLCNSSSWVE